MIVFGGWDGSEKADLQALRFSDEVPVVVRGLGKDPGRLPRNGIVQAAILGSAGLSVDSILTQTVTLGGAPALDTGRSGSRGERRDVNDDHFEDIVLSFRAESLHVAASDTLLRLWGRTPHFAVRGAAMLESPPLVRGPTLRRELIPTPGVLSLISMSPSPSMLRVRFSLANPLPADLAVYDVAGRKMEERNVTGFGPGEHTIEIGTGQLPSGLYLIRLRQDGRQVVTRGLLIR
jgi:hypothetical protein